MAATIKGFASDWSVPEGAKTKLNALYATLDANGKQPVRKGELAVRPEDYGASGDGVTNDRTAILAAAAAAAPFGATLLMTAPKYNTGTSPLSLPAGTKMRGYSLIEGGATGSTTLDVRGNSTFEGISVRNSGTGYRFAVNIQPNSDNVHFVNVTFPNGEGVGVYMNAAGISNVLVDRCKFDGHAYAVLSNSGMNGEPLSGAHDIKNVTVTRSVFTNISAEAIEFNHPFNASGNGERGTAQNFLVSHNIMSVTKGTGQTAGFAIGMAGISNATVTGNIVRAARYEGIHAEDDCKNVVITGNHIANITGDYAYAGISILPSCVNVVVSGNTVENIKGTGVAGGIVAGFNAYPVHTQRMTVTNNIVRDVDGDGISVAADEGGGFRVLDNDISNASKNGIRVAGGVKLGYEVFNNKIHTVGAHGVRVDHAMAAARPHSVRDNTIANATLGDYYGQTLSAGLSTVVRNRSSYVESGPASTSSNATLSLMRLGGYAEGTVRVTTHSLANQVNRAVSVFKIRWTGSALTYTRVLGNTNGSFTAGSLSVVDGVLTFTSFVGSTGISLRGSAEFVGLSVEDGVARTGTVNGVIPTLSAAATDAATTQTLVNEIRSALIAWGLAN